MNSNYQVNPATNYDAVAIESQLTREWTPQVIKTVPLLAMIKEGKGNFNKGFTVNGTKALVPLVVTDIAAFNEATAGIADASEIPNSWPAFDETEGFTQAVYEFCHIERSMTFKSSEKKLLSGTHARANLLEGKTTQLMAKFMTIIGSQVEGNQADSRTSLLGLPYAIATNNTVGGVPQGTYDYWQAKVTAAPAGVLSLTTINGIYDQIGREAGFDGQATNPDFMLLSYPSGGFNTFNKVRESISPAERYFNKDFSAKYGLKTFSYLDMMCLMSPRLATGTVLIGTSSTWFWGGQDTPTQLQVQRILGSSADEHRYEWWGVLGCKEIRRNGKITGATS